MERYNIIGIIITVIFSLIIILGIWHPYYGLLTCYSFNCIAGATILALGGIGLFISLIVWLYYIGVLKWRMEREKREYRERKKRMDEFSEEKRMEKLGKIKEKEEMSGAKMEAASNVSYMLRIEKEVGDSGAERINYICGYCGLKNNLKTIDEEHGIFQCLNCGAENHLLK